MLWMRPCSSSRAIAWTTRFSRRVGPGRAMPGQVDRRVLVDERQRHELGEAPGGVLDAAPVRGSGRASAAGGRRGRTSSSSSTGCPSECAVVTTSIHAAAGSLPFVSTHRTSSSRISAAVPGMVSSPASRSSVRNSRTDTPGLGRAGDDLHRREGVHVHTGHARLDRPYQVGVGGRRQGRVDAALHAHLGRADAPRLLGPVGDLVEGEPVGVGVALALGEGAEPAADVADVGEVDVPVDDVGHVVADGVASRRRRPDAGQRFQRRTFGARTGPAPPPRAGGRAARPGRVAASRRPPRTSASSRPGADGARPSRQRARPPPPSRRRPCRSRRAGRSCGRSCRWSRGGRSGRSPARRRSRRPAPARPARRGRADSTGQPGVRVGERQHVRGRARDPATARRRSHRRTYSG